MSSRCFLALAGEYPIACGQSMRSAARAGSTALIAAYALGKPVVEGNGLSVGITVAELRRGACPCAEAGLNMRGGFEAAETASEALVRLGVIQPGSGCGCCGGASA